MNTSIVTEQFHKKNGAIHWQRCAEFYGAKHGVTARAWYKAGAPIENAEQMRAWLQAREDERLKKIADGNIRYQPKEAEIVRLHVEERMGLRAISKHFSGRPTTPSVRNILIRNGVYHGNEVYQQQIRESNGRKARHIEDEREKRHRIAVCLWRLRKGTGVEATCKRHGWSKGSIWNALGKLESYKKFKARQKSKWVDKRSYGKQYSRKFPKEAEFQRAIEEIIKKAGIGLTMEARLHGARTRVDFKLDDSTFVELKVGLSSGQCYEFIGQAFHYRKHAKKIVLCIPSDIQFRRDLYELIIELGVVVCNENNLVRVIEGELPLVASDQVVQQRYSRFVCKCCGSSEKRRRNSCCVDCAPLIPEMRFDVSADRWVKRTG